MVSVDVTSLVTDLETDISITRWILKGLTVDLPSLISGTEAEKSGFALAKRFIKWG